jgi:hypothetical protein
VGGKRTLSSLAFLLLSLSSCLGVALLRLFFMYLLSCCHTIHREGQGRVSERALGRPKVRVSEWDEPRRRWSRP